MSYTLYGGRYTRALITEMVMAEGDLAYEHREVDILNREHRSAEFLAINPAGWVPVLITPEGERLYETPAINLYLAERHGLTDLAPGFDEPGRGLFLSGLFYLSDDLEPVMKRYFYPHRYVLRTDDTSTMKRRSLEIALERLAVIDGRLQTAGPYHLGDRFSLVDLTMSYWAAHIEPTDRLEPYSGVRRCMKLVAERPKLRARFEELKQWKDEFADMQGRGQSIK